jgi:putative copper export protein
MKISLTINCFGNCMLGAFSASLPPRVARRYQSCQMGVKHMLRRQTMTAMSGVFSQCVHGAGTSDTMKETMIARMIAVSFGILWAVVIGLMLNGS